MTSFKKAGEDWVKSIFSNSLKEWQSCKNGGGRSCVGFLVDKQ